MLVSKIKPCMSKFTLSNGETANGSLNQSRFLRWSKVTWITVVILELIHAELSRYNGKVVTTVILLSTQNQTLLWHVAAKSSLRRCFLIFDVGFSYHCEAGFAKRLIVHPLIGNV